MAKNYDEPDNTNCFGNSLSNKERMINPRPIVAITSKINV
jgi:hypothetical protein